MLLSIWRAIPAALVAPRQAIVPLKHRAIKEQPILSILIVARAADSTISLRYSCREGICGSCAISTNGRLVLACLHYAGARCAICAPMQHMAVVRDLVPDLTVLYTAHAAIRPWAAKQEHIRAEQRIITQRARALIETHFECVLCGACLGACPSYWWHAGSYAGPAVLLQHLRWRLQSSTKSREELYISESRAAEACHSILACARACPKGLNPANAVRAIHILGVLREADRALLLTANEHQAQHHNTTSSLYSLHDWAPIHNPKISSSCLPHWCIRKMTHD
nr:succinate dehydrogenase subunit 2 [Chroothece mobilis]